MRPSLLAVIILVGAHASAQSYKGPLTLGPFRIDRDISMKSLFEDLGHPSKVAGDTFCYQQEGNRAYLVLTRMAEVYDASVAGDVLLSNFPNCLDRPVQVTSDDLATWRTEKGIRLGATTEDVRIAYGKPSRQDKIEGTKYQWVIHGDGRDDHYSEKKRPEIGDTVLVYQGSANDLSIAEFGIREGKVVWISLSKNE